VDACTWQWITALRTQDPSLFADLSSATDPAHTATTASWGRAFNSPPSGPSIRWKPRATPAPHAPDFRIMKLKERPSRQAAVGPDGPAEEARYLSKTTVGAFVTNPLRPTNQAAVNWQYGLRESDQGHAEDCLPPVKADSRRTRSRKTPWQRHFQRSDGPFESYGGGQQQEEPTQEGGKENGKRKVHRMTPSISLPDLNRTSPIDMIRSDPYDEELQTPKKEETRKRHLSYKYLKPSPSKSAFGGVSKSRKRCRVPGLEGDVVGVWQDLYKGSLNQTRSMIKWHASLRSY